ncbi:TetR/AcrR family transcriptional regulator [Erythrobacter sp.]|jgi:AcrR family transcriptional regulator|uniref:TetR/AcrR family transcriptional regulator n=1 Tax=Erythrobacter sp. TaxID=1042 RepID=UPI002ECDACE2|nr:TetR/AcrR family transcriptional regulator [Erythrobacter sp.]
MTEALTDSRDRIRETALRLFAERGVDSVSIAEICRDAGLANGTFYNFYRNKSELVAGFLQETYETLARLLREVEGRSNDAREEHRRDVEIIVNFTAENSEMIRVALRDHGARRMVEHDISELFVKQRAAGLRRGLERSTYRPGVNAELVARAEHGLMSDIISWWLDNRDRMAREDLIDELVAIRLRITNGKVED